MAVQSRSVEELDRRCRCGCRAWMSPDGLLEPVIFLAGAELTRLTTIDIKTVATRIAFTRAQTLDSGVSSGGFLR